MPSQRITPIHYLKIIKDYLIMVKPGVKRPVVIKTSPHEVPVTHIRTNLTNADISRERYFELLNQL